jgi:hypothetical protein
MVIQSILIGVGLTLCIAILFHLVAWEWLSGTISQILEKGKSPLPTGIYTVTGFHYRPRGTYCEQISGLLVVKEDLTSHSHMRVSLVRNNGAEVAFTYDIPFGETAKTAIWDGKNVHANPTKITRKELNITVAGDKHKQEWELKLTRMN